MARTLYLHIGWPKCASTSLQRMLFDNREALAKRSYHYPVVFGKPMGNAAILVQHALKERFGPGVFSINNPGALDFSDRAAFFQKNYLNTDLENIILSSEGLFRAVQESDFEFLFKPFDRVKVIWVIRPKMHWLESHFCQGLKTGRYRGELIEELQGIRLQASLNNVMIYMRHYEFWKNKVGADNLNILFMGKKFAPVEDQFLDALLGETPTDFTRPPHENQASDIVTLAACAALEPGGDKPAYIERLQAIIRHGKKLGLTRKPALYDRECYANLFERFDEDDHAFADAQQEITLRDLQPDYTQQLDTPDSLHKARRSPKYAQLRAHLARFEITI